MNIQRFLRLSAHIQMLPILESGEETLVGGQAVMEGVMMRAPHSYCVAVRKANGEILTVEEPLAKVSEKYPIFKLPVLRGLGTLGQAMTLGYKALRFSANAALDDAAEKENAGKETAKKPAEISSWMMTLNLIFSLGFFIFLYKFVPLFLATRLGHVVPSLSSRFATNMTDGVIRMAIFLVFLYLLSQMKDIRRVFEYHGAEHKVVFNFESRTAGKRGERAEIRDVSSALRDELPARGDGDFDDRLRAVPFDGFAAKLLARIALLPVIAGLSYELIRFAAKRQGTLHGPAHGAGSVAAAHHHQAAGRRPSRGRHPCPRRRDGAGSRNRAANW